MGARETDDRAAVACWPTDRWRRERASLRPDRLQGAMAAPGAREARPSRTANLLDAWPVDIDADHGDRRNAGPKNTRLVSRLVKILKPRPFRQSRTSPQRALRLRPSLHGDAAERLGYPAQPVVGVPPTMAREQPRDHGWHELARAALTPDLSFSLNVPFKFMGVVMSNSHSFQSW
jgi:hypothetical protein